MKPKTRALLARIALLAWALVTALLAWLLLAMPQTFPGGPNRDYVLELPPNASYEELGELLAKEGLVEHPRAWAVYMRLLTDEEELRRGTWVINRALSPAQHVPRIAKNHGRARVEVLIPEGFTQFDVATRLERFGIAPREEVLRAVQDRALLDELNIPGPSAEGYLFPATYPLLQDQDPRKVVRRMVQVFQKRTAARFAAYAREQADGEAPPFTPHEVVVLASVVEREARLPEEQAVIAGVFINRLLDPNFRPHRLQADPTVAYGCLVMPAVAPSCAEFDGRRVTPAMVRDPKNPYNTYRHDGLPPGPIANPGERALDAVLHPEKHNYFYFVAKGGGRHAFSATLEEHNANIRAAP